MQTLAPAIRSRHQRQSILFGPIISSGHKDQLLPRHASVPVGIEPTTPFRRRRCLWWSRRDSHSCLARLFRSLCFGPGGPRRDEGPVYRGPTAVSRITSKKIGGTGENRTHARLAPGRVAAFRLSTQSTVPMALSGGTSGPFTPCRPFRPAFASDNQAGSSLWRLQQSLGAS